MKKQKSRKFNNIHLLKGIHYQYNGQRVRHYRNKLELLLFCRLRAHYLSAAAKVTSHM